MLQLVVTADAVLRVAAPSALWLPLLPILGMAAALAMMVLTPRRGVGIVYLLLGCAAMVAYASHMNTILGGLRPDELYLLSPLVTALAVVGTVAGRELSGLVWTIVGTIVGQGTLLAIQVSFALSPSPDLAAGIISVLYSSLFLLLWHSDRKQRVLATSEVLGDDQERQEELRYRESWEAAIVYETVLGDLALVAHGASKLSEAERARLLRTVGSVSSVALPSEQEPTAGRPSDFYGVISEFQWRGLSIDVSGDSGAIDDLATAVKLALLGALRSALDNVLMHSERTSAEVFIDLDTDNLTIMIVDDGIGFELATVPEDRLGVRISILRRIENCGGSAAIWSSAGAGTSVVVKLPRKLHRAATVPRL